MKQPIKKPKIISQKFHGRKYYSIVYYDVFTKDYVNGYGSYNKKFVKKWLEEEFVAVTRLDLKQRACVDLFVGGEKE